jgi:hypothetical protein
MPPRQDGYRPIAEPLWVWATVTQSQITTDTWRLFWSAARRLDTGHRQIERVREALSVLPPKGTPAGRQAIHDVVGDAEMAVWALDKALDIAHSLSGRYRITVPFPKFVLERRALVADLRDHYSHIDERALGRKKGKADPRAAAQAFEFLALVSQRILTDGNASIGIDEEATQLCIEARDYLVEAWAALCLGPEGVELPPSPRLA